MRKGIAIIAVLHDLNLSAQCPAKTLLLNKGKNFAAGSPAKVITEENINKVIKQVLIEHHPFQVCPRLSFYRKKREAKFHL